MVSCSFRGTAGPIFLRSSVGAAGLDLDLTQNTHASYGLNLYSDIPLWEEGGEGAFGQIDEIGLPPVPALGPNQLGVLVVLVTAMGCLVVQRRASARPH